MGEASGVWAMISYAIVVTIIAVFATLWIGIVAAKSGVRDEEPKS